MVNVMYFVINLLSIFKMKEEDAIAMKDAMRHAYLNVMRVTSQ